MNEERPDQIEARNGHHCRIAQDSVRKHEGLFATELWQKLTDSDRAALGTIAALEYQLERLVHAGVLAKRVRRDPACVKADEVRWFWAG